MIDLIITWIKVQLAKLAPKPMPTPPSIPPVPPSTPTAPIPADSKATLTNMCKGITQMEGANPNNNNPGNCRFYHGGYLPIYGDVRESSGGFAIFPTLALGELYLQNLIKSIIHSHPQWSLLQFFEEYAPSSDGNDPVHYSKFVAGYMGVDNTFTIGNIKLV